jgi:hypothetical protein
MKHLQAAFLIRTGLCADPNPVQALNTMRIRIQGSKPMQIRFWADCRLKKFLQKFRVACSIVLIPKQFKNLFVLKIKIWVQKVLRRAVWSQI